jgi:hypothetical protein
MEQPLAALGYDLLKVALRFLHPGLELGIRIAPQLDEGGQMRQSGRRVTHRQVQSPKALVGYGL